MRTAEEPTGEKQRHVKQRDGHNMRVTRDGHNMRVTRDSRGNILRPVSTGTQESTHKSRDTRNEVNRNLFTLVNVITLKSVGLSESTTRQR